jgi:hypothetical protein
MTGGETVIKKNFSKQFGDGSEKALKEVLKNCHVDLKEWIQKMR